LKILYESNPRIKLVMEEIKDNDKVHGMFE